MKLAPNEVYGDMTILKRFHTVIPLSCSQVKRVATVWKGRNLCFLMFWKLFFGSKIGSKLEEGYKQQGCILSPYLFNSYEEYITHNAGLDESQVGIKIARRNNQQHQICRYHSNGRKWRGTKEAVDEGEKRKVKEMAWNPIFKKLRSQHPVPSPDGK